MVVGSPIFSLNRVVCCASWSMRSHRATQPLIYFPELRGTKAYNYVDYSPGYFQKAVTDRKSNAGSRLTGVVSDDDGINYRPLPSYHEKRQIQTLKMEIDGVEGLAVPAGGEDSDDEGT